MLDPEQISLILAESATRYEFVDRPVDGMALGDIVGEPALDPRPVDPFVVVEMRSEGPRLRSRPPPDSIRETFEQARVAFEADELEIAAALYARAAQRAPEYFKAHTYVGRTLFLQGRLEDARLALERAVQLNPLDYQAHLFLGDVHFEAGRPVLAKEALTRAFVLNRTNPTVVQRLDRVLAALDLRLAEPRLLPELRIESEAGRVQIHVAGERWRALGLCLACWTHERACRDRSTPEQDPLRLQMYRECLIHEAASTAIRRGDGSLPSRESAFESAISNGYLEAIIFWEVLALRVPMVVFLVPEAVRQDVADYIDRYVYESTRVI